MATLGPLGQGPLTLGEENRLYVQLASCCQGEPNHPCVLYEFTGQAHVTVSGGTVERVAPFMFAIMTVKFSKSGERSSFHLSQMSFCTNK